MGGSKLQRWQLYDSRTKRTPRVATLSFRNYNNPQNLIYGTKMGPKLKQMRSKLTMNNIKTFYLTQAVSEAHNLDP